MSGHGPWDWRRRALCPSSGIPPAVWTADRRPRAVLCRQMVAVCQRCSVRAECAASALVHGDESAMVSGVWIPAESSQNEQICSEARRQLTVIAGEALEEAKRAYPGAGEGAEDLVVELELVRAAGRSVDRAGQWGPGGDERLGAAV